NTTQATNTHTPTRPEAQIPKMGAVPPVKKKRKPEDAGKRKAPAGMGKAARRDRKMKGRNAKDMQATLGQLHAAKKRKEQGQENCRANERGGGFAKKYNPEMSKEALEPINRYFWSGPKPEGEPDDALKKTRQMLGIKVKGSPTPAPVQSFLDPQLPPAFARFKNGARGKRFSKPTAIQMQVWPAALCGLDVLGIAPTGSGKTLAYLLPAVIHIEGQAARPKQCLSPQCLVLLPTRELAAQVSDQCKGKGGLRQVLGIRAEAVYGGVGKELQMDAILTSGTPE
ncbi:unnamed protein product, partial [Polarella glacialis]